jgi:hypothetical protein
MIMHDTSIWSQNFLRLVKKTISQVKPSFKEQNEGEMYLSGWRFNDEERNVATFLSLVIELNDHVIPNDTKRLEYVSSILAEQLAWKALETCADSDEWYDFHKDWGDHS